MKMECLVTRLLCPAILTCAAFAAGLDRQAPTTIKADVNMVIVPVLVADKGGKPIPALRKRDFHVFENGKEQKIAELIPGADPFHVALMIDSSGSTFFRQDEMQNAAIAFLGAMRPQDRIMIVTFDRETRFDTGFTSNRESLRRAIRLPHPEGGQTRLFDALEQVHERLSSASGRKAIVLFSDGVDNTSQQADEAGTLRMAEQSDVIIYAVQYDTRRSRLPDRFQVPMPPGYATFNELYSRAVRYLRNLTAQSGGRVCSAGSLIALKDAFAQIAGELQRQYTLCYYPSDPPRDGSFRRIRVSVDYPGVTVRTRAGYRPVAGEKERNP
jgi:Ca-activated chloride channel family protein